MITANWTTDRITTVTSEEFFNLVERNRQHIYKTFPVTTVNCADLGKTKTFIENALATEKNKNGYYFYLRDVATNLLMGYIVIKNIDPKIMKCELAYFIDKEYQGQGITTQAIANTVKHCFDELGMNKVYICTATTNIGSQKVAVKNGFIQEGILRKEFKNGEGKLEDIMYFGLIKSDYMK
ncbi:GNAT family N-acetyltransferase [Flavobacterium salilacus subsp. salilacus]|uniref:GNAT family N-acetyltransferase n=1 Tax=Flavobacterium TaxID=237 RepID=UPI0010757D8E|nr:MULTISPECIES: GNAT family protein [Flavobacterium]KAF2518918.1 GNAT family N-acetyltransferase [Flavobacterium salilacus subsp. salilacus]MBE1614920.1 GNAT family N-acetyltransferase [Flavobacterium sp. SaA2.13]